MTTISNIASIVTLIMFATYYIGRIITIFQEKGIYKDRIIIPSTNDTQKMFEAYHVVEEVHLPNDDSNVIYGILQSAEGIRNINVYMAEVDFDKNRFVKKEKIFSHKFLNVDQSIALFVETGDTFPRLIIEYQTYDFKKVTLEWRDNLKDGVMSEFVEPKNTLNSVLYYLFR